MPYSILIRVSGSHKKRHIVEDITETLYHAYNPGRNSAKTKPTTHELLRNTVATFRITTRSRDQANTIYDFFYNKRLELMKFSKGRYSITINLPEEIEHGQSARKIRKN